MERKGANAIFGGIKHCKQLRHVNLGDAMVLKGLGESDLPGERHLHAQSEGMIAGVSSGTNVPNNTSLCDASS